MGYEAELARSIAVSFECKKDGLRQNQDGGVRLTLNIHPNDMPASLYTQPMGQRYVVSVVPIGDDDAPQIDEPKGKSKAGEGKLLAQDAEFKRYSGAENAESWMKNYIGIKSCSELIEGSEAYNRFVNLRKDFYSWKQAQEQVEYYSR
jgi:hypothetical protein